VIRGKKRSSGKASLGRAYLNQSRHTKDRGKIKYSFKTKGTGQEIQKKEKDIDAFKSTSLGCKS